MSGQNGWIGVDLDGTLAVYDKWVSCVNIGEPVAPMIARVKQWLADGVTVKIFTARVWSDGTPARDRDASYALLAIQDWCELHIGQVLPVTCTKDYSMIELWDDRAVQVEKNTGAIVGHSTRGGGQ